MPLREPMRGDANKPVEGDSTNLDARFSRTLDLKGLRHVCEEHTAPALDRDHGRPGPPQMRPGDTRIEGWEGPFALPATRLPAHDLRQRERVRSTHVGQSTRAVARMAEREQPHRRCGLARSRASQAPHCIHRPIGLSAHLRDRIPHRRSVTTNPPHASCGQRLKPRDAHIPSVQE